jgi:hypothetical protein
MRESERSLLGGKFATRDEETSLRGGEMTSRVIEIEM